MTRAQTVYGLGTLTMDFLGNLAGAQGLVPLDPVTGMAGTAIPVTGVAARQSLVGMDFRANNGQLYALGYDSAALAPAPNAQFYTLNPTSGAAATPGIGAVAYTNAFPSATSTTLYAFDELNTSALGNTANTALLSIVPPRCGHAHGAGTGYVRQLWHGCAGGHRHRYLRQRGRQPQRSFSDGGHGHGQQKLLPPEPSHRPSHPTGQRRAP